MSEVELTTMRNRLESGKLAQGAARPANSCFMRTIALLCMALLLAGPHSPAAENHAAIIMKKDLVYGQVYGAGLIADIAYPEGKGPFPAIISVHGGRWIAGSRTDPSTINVRQWAGLGFFAMSIDY